MGEERGKRKNNANATKVPQQMQAKPSFWGRLPPANEENKHKHTSERDIYISRPSLGYQKPTNAMQEALDSGDQDNKPE